MDIKVKLAEPRRIEPLLSNELSNLQQRSLTPLKPHSVLASDRAVVIRIRIDLEDIEKVLQQCHEFYLRHGDGTHR